MAEEDVLIGRNIARFREPRSQADVAKAMRARGWKWAQNTVSAVEQGERPLRFAEAIDLAHVLDVNNVEAFARESEWVTVKLWAAAAHEAQLNLIAAVDAYREAQVNLAIAGDELVSKEGLKLTNEVIGPLESWVGTSAVDIVLRSFLRDDDPEASRTRSFVASVRDGREDRGGNGPWMNALFDLQVREDLAALKELDERLGLEAKAADGEHQATS